MSGRVRGCENLPWNIRTNLPTSVIFTQIKVKITPCSHWSKLVFPKPPLIPALINCTLPWSCPAHKTRSEIQNSPWEPKNIHSTPAFQWLVSQCLNLAKLHLQIPKQSISPSKRKSESIRTCIVFHSSQELKSLYLNPELPCLPPTKKSSFLPMWLNRQHLSSSFCSKSSIVLQREST